MNQAKTTKSIKADVYRLKKLKKERHIKTTRGVGKKKKTSRFEIFQQHNLYYH